MIELFDTKPGSNEASMKIVDINLELVVCENEVQELPDPDQDDQHHGEQNRHSPELLNTNIFLDRLFTVHKVSSFIQKFPVTVSKCCIASHKYMFTVYECFLMKILSCIRVLCPGILTREFFLFLICGDINKYINYLQDRFTFSSAIVFFIR